MVAPPHWTYTLYSISLHNHKDSDRNRTETQGTPKRRPRKPCSERPPRHPLTPILPFTFWVECVRGAVVTKKFANSGPENS